MLSVIIGYSELARDRLPADHPVQANLAEILQAARRSADITRQLLAFARKQTINPEVLDLNAAVENLLKMLHRLIGEDIELIWQPAEDLDAIKIDPSQIDQILANLCVNARDAVAGVGKIQIETAQVAVDAAFCAEYPDCAAGDYVRLSVSDNGCGMDRDTLARIFEPFFTTKPTGQGTGLGLATVFGIVMQNKGFIKVASAPGQGSRFDLYLPAHREEKTAAQAAEPVEIPLGRGETVLVVEDEAELRQLAVTLLERLGYRVWVAADAKEAVEIVAQQRGGLDLLLTDLIMPGMNGRELAARLTRECPRLKTVFMSGYASEGIGCFGAQDEAVQFIQKPFSFKDLGATIRAALDRP